MPRRTTCVPTTASKHDRPHYSPVTSRCSGLDVIRRNRLLVLPAPGAPGDCQPRRATAALIDRFPETSATGGLDLEYIAGHHLDLGVSGQLLD